MLYETVLKAMEVKYRNVYGFNKSVFYFSFYFFQNISFSNCLPQNLGSIILAGNQKKRMESFIKIHWMNDAIISDLTVKI